MLPSDKSWEIMSSFWLMRWKWEKQNLNIHFGKKVILSGEKNLCNSSSVKHIMEENVFLDSFTVTATEDVMEV